MFLCLSFHASGAREFARHTSSNAATLNVNQLAGRLPHCLYLCTTESRGQLVIEEQESERYEALALNHPLVSTHHLHSSAAQFAHTTEGHPRPAKSEGASASGSSVHPPGGSYSCKHSSTQPRQPFLFCTLAMVAQCAALGTHYAREHPRPL